MYTVSMITLWITIIATLLASQILHWLFKHYKISRRSQFDPISIESRFVSILGELNVISSRVNAMYFSSGATGYTGYTGPTGLGPASQQNGAVGQAITPAPEPTPGPTPEPTPQLPAPEVDYLEEARVV